MGFEAVFQDFEDVFAHGAVAAAVSGGPDSMALTHLLSVAAAARGAELHAITVDHGLRAEAAVEARAVGDIVSSWAGVRHATLTWAGQKPESRILEEARAARYDLMENYMKEHGIRHLFVAHHQDDQAETFLIRLSKGSGLDGLAGMQKRQARGDIVLCRPLLDVPKADLITYCAAQEIDFIQDPTNENEKYVRPRLRAARAVLEEEGLSAKRLSVTAARLLRARRALEDIAAQVYEDCTAVQDNAGVTFDWARLKMQPEEIVLRCVLRAMDAVAGTQGYGPRMERAEGLTARMLYDAGFSGASLGGCVFAIQGGGKLLSVRKEFSA